MKLLSFSGGSTKICALAAHGTRILTKENYKPDVIVGISSGSLIMLPLILGKHEMLKEITTTLKLSDIFSKLPVNEKGKVPFSSYVRSVITGSLGEMENLRYLIKYFVSEKEFKNFCKNPESPLLYAGVTNMNTGEFKLIKLNDLTYEAFVTVLMNIDMNWQHELMRVVINMTISVSAAYVVHLLKKYHWDKKQKKKEI